jgi:hypothetical protein
MIGLKQVSLVLINADTSLNVITVAGRSLMEYQFVLDAAKGAHVRVFKGFDDPKEQERLHAEEEDLVGALLPPGWMFRRDYEFERQPNELFGQAVELLRRSNLRLMFNADVEAAKVAFTEEDLKLLEGPLAEHVTEFLATCGVKTPNEAWREARAGLDAAEKEAGEVGKKRKRG